MIRVILVEPHYAGNIGSVARLIKNFGIHELVLVNPLAYHLSEEAFTWAVHAKDVLERALIFKTLEEALKDASVVVGTTAKPNEKMVRRTPVEPRKMAEILTPYWFSEEVAAIVFGREPSGLTNEELDLCDFIVTIPTTREYSAMNLSHSVAVILYELYLKRHQSKNRYPVPARAWQTLERFLTEVVQITNRHNPREVVKGIMAAYRRGAVTEKEINSLIGILSYCVRRCRSDTDSSKKGGQQEA